jgi:hypothetical protein
MAAANRKKSGPSTRGLSYPVTSTSKEIRLADVGAYVRSLRTTKQVARELRVVPRTVRRLVAAGELRPHPNLHGPNGDSLFDPDHIEALRQRRRAGRTLAQEDAEILRGALAYIAENESRPLCLKCAAREMNRGGTFCTPCEEQHRIWLANHATPAERLSS